MPEKSQEITEPVTDATTQESEEPEVSDENASENGKTRISEETYSIPFGRYVDTEFNEPRSNEEFVGREIQRAKFIDHLINAGPFGATLITGRRGVGKSSFVRYCIEEYRRSTFKRFLRSTDMHSRIDFLGIAVITVIFLAGALLLTGLLEITLTAAQYNGFLYLVAAPVAVFCAYPMIFSSRLLFKVIENFFRVYDLPAESTVPSQAKAAGISLAIISVIVVAFWFLPIFGNPLIGVSLIIMAVSATYATVNLVAYVPIAIGSEPDPKSLHIAQRVVLLVALVWLVVVASFWVMVIIYGIKLIPIINLGSAAIFFAFGFAFRGLRIVGDKDSRSEFKKSFGRPKKMFLSLGLVSLIAVLVPVAWIFNEPNHWGKIIQFSVQTAVPLGIMYFLGRLMFDVPEMKFRAVENPKSPKFQPQPMLILFIKALVSIYIGIQLTIPILGKLWNFLPDEFLKSAHDLTIEMNSWLEDFVLSFFEAGEESNKELYIDTLYSVMSLVSAGDSPIKSSIPTLFAHHPNIDFLWIGAVSLLLWIFYLIEYEWVMRPFAQTREDSAVDPGKRNEKDDLNLRRKDNSAFRKIFRELALYTFPWHIYNFRFPTLVVTVNIGFDNLTNKQVIEAMLVGLRDQYYRAFLAWNSAVSNLRRFMYLFGVILIAALLAKQWIYSSHEHCGPSTGTEVKCEFVEGPILKLAEIEEFKSWMQIEVVPIHLEYAPPHTRLWQFILHENPTMHPVEPDQKAESVVPDNTEVAVPVGKSGSNGSSETLQAKSEPVSTPREFTHIYTVSIRVYHGLIFLLIIGFGAIVSRVGPPIYPYQRNIRKIDALLNGMNGRLTRTRHRESKWGGYFFKNDEEHRYEQEQLDPAVVESAFLRILEDMQAGAYFVPGSGPRSFRITKPEITFVFDELDKISGAVMPERRKDGGKIDEIASLDMERRRCAVLYSLFSDLKRTITSGPARFIFVGGRLLHDEWLADQAKRQPLLSSIFRNHFYIPALLCDFPTKFETKPDDLISSHQPAYRTREYLAAQYVKATRKYREWLRNRSSPGGIMAWQAKESPHFVQQDIVKAAGMHRDARDISNDAPPDAIQRFRVLELTTGMPIVSPFARDADTEKVRAWEKAIIDDLVAFLSYRSAGNTKRLRELVSTMIRPIGSTPVADDPVVRWERHDSFHILYLNDDTLYRIRMISDLYRHIMTIFGARMFHEDEKTAISLFYLMDFLFKFHRRGFAWSNLERLEELSHMHKSPDLRMVLRRMVEGSTGIIFHRVLNGIYAFRFQSGFAKEIDYLSRRSSEEMAAFNFTLDESQALKVHLKNQTNIGERSNFEKIAGIGELHEYDQEFEEARECYRTAIRLLDEGFERSTAAVIARRVEPSSDTLLANLSWGTARLRLTLQIGMTYELVGDLERAMSRYSDARAFADTMLARLLKETRNDINHLADLNASKNLSILFQSAMAEAWATEKSEIGMDASCNVAELYLSAIRDVMPFVKIDEAKPTEQVEAPEHSQLSMVAAGLEIKVGDLYFFKGSQATTLPFINGLAKHCLRRAVIKKKSRVTASRNTMAGPTIAAAIRMKGPTIAAHEMYKTGIPPYRQLSGSNELDKYDSYILRAIFHYGVAIHDVRRLIWHRIESSKYTLSIRDVGDAIPTFTEGALPTFCYRFASEAFGNLADALFSRVSMIELNSMARCMKYDENINKNQYEYAKGTFLSACIKWLALSDAETDAKDKFPLVVAFKDHNKNNAYCGFSLGDMSDWLGRWTQNSDLANEKRIKFGERNSSPVRLVVGLNFLLTCAFLRRSGGERREGIEELFRVGDTISRVLWNSLKLEKLKVWKGEIKALKVSLLCDDCQVEFTTLKERFERLEDCSLESLKGEKYISYLLDLAFFSLERADELLFGRHAVDPYLARGDLGEEYTYYVGRTVPAHALTLLCSLALLIEHCDISKSNKNKFEEKVRNLLQKWTGHEIKEDLCNSSGRKVILKHLMHSVRKNRYPILNRLNAYKLFLDSQVLHGDEVEWEIESNIALQDFGQTVRRYGNAMHFTPILHGSTNGLFYIRRVMECMKVGSTVNPKAIVQDRMNAARELQLSKEMHTMGRGFYQNISNLYFLYDDFNDRTIHHNHAVQMMCADLRTILHSLVDNTPEHLRNLE